ncbi:hypothetical protein [Paraburkholderia sp. JHI869]|uniref:hypothetical protein n=1 Tax=Paraburkholderia sp. JHI869 TaxID=3112959 RepID=UPI003181F746
MKSTTNRRPGQGRRRAGVWLLGAVALALGCTACKRVNEGEHPQTLDSSSSSQMSAPAGAQATPASGPKS